MLTDSHCHLEQVEDHQKALQEAEADGVTRVVAVAEDEASSKTVLELKERYPSQILAGIGFHPMFTVSRSPEEVESCLQFVDQNMARADELGEVGLDFKYAKSEPEQLFQRQVLQQQLQYAARDGKPINLHSRWALRQTMEVAVDFTRETGLGAQLHWFTQSKKLIRITNPARVYVSVGPTLLYDDSSRQVAATIDRELLLLETDSPVPFQGESARPAWVRRVAEVVAELWECDLSEVAEQTEQNLERYLGR